MFQNKINRITCNRNASTTVGTPIAITGIPNVSLLSSLRLFPTPDPGWIPVSEICIVLFTRSIERQLMRQSQLQSLGLSSQ